MDYTTQFKTTETFKSKEDIIKWAREVGRLHGFVIITLRSDSGKGSRRPRVTLGCERSGKCDSRRTSILTVRYVHRHAGTKKCGCPFRLMGKKQATGDQWELMVVEGMHNHEVEDTGKGHSFQGRLSQEEKSLLKDMCKTGKQPKEILRALKERDKNNKSTGRTIYNERRSLKRIQNLEDQSGLWQKLTRKAEEYNYIEKHRTSPKIGRVLDFFLTHPTSLELLLAFPTVLIIDFIQWGKTMWDMLEIFGVTSTNMKFFVALAILPSKRKSSYEWALNSLRGVMEDNGIPMPDIVIFCTSGEDKIDVAPMKAINGVFSSAKLLLSTGSIGRIVYIVSVNCCHVMHAREWDSFQKKWALLVASPTETDFEQHLMELGTQIISMYPEAVEYVEDNLVKPYKEMFVAAWTNKVMHFGNTDPIDKVMHFENRNPIILEQPSDQFMTLYLYNCQGSVAVEQTVIDAIWKTIYSLNEERLIKIKASFVESLKNEYVNDEDEFSVLKELHGVISIYALKMIHNQTMLANEIDDYHSEYCSCAIKHTHGLPCAHEIAKYKRKGQPIPLECINSHWRKLHLEPLRKARELNVDERIKRRRLSEEINTNTHSALSSPDIVEAERNSPNAGPSIVPTIRERQPEDKVYDIHPTKQLEFVDVCPLLRAFILDVKDVPRDGHCGFKAIASFMGYSEEVGWVKVREDLKDELQIFSAHYAQLFGSDQRVNELVDALKYFESICLQKKHWMTMPDMGHIIASCYNVVLIHLSSVQCFTFFPLRTAPTSISISSTREIVIGFVEEHFVQVYLKTGHPMPPPTPAPTRKNPHVATNWERFHEQRSTEWATLYQGRIEHFKSLQSEVVSQKNPIVLDIDSLPSVDNMDYYFDSLQGD